MGRSNLSCGREDRITCTIAQWSSRPNGRTSLHFSCCMHQAYCRASALKKVYPTPAFGGPRKNLRIRITKDSCTYCPATLLKKWAKSTNGKAPNPFHQLK